MKHSTVETTPPMSQGSCSQHVDSPARTLHMGGFPKLGPLFGVPNFFQGGPEYLGYSERDHD